MEEVNIFAIDSSAVFVLCGIIGFLATVLIGMLGWYLNSINTSLKELSNKFSDFEVSTVTWPACRDIQGELKRRIEKLERK